MGLCGLPEDRNPGFALPASAQSELIRFTAPVSHATTQITLRDGLRP